MGHGENGENAKRLEREERRAVNKSKKEERQRQRQQKSHIKQPETIGVMFVDQTPNGLLAKRLQEAEDRIARVTGYRIRIVELSGSHLSHLFPNTNPWAGMDCGRKDCVTCGQGGEEMIDCKKRNILYESECTVCNPGREELKEKERDLTKKIGVYVGESARSIFERAREHGGDYIGMKEDSHMVKHWLTSHSDLQEPPMFRFRVIRSFKDAMTRQISEAVRIELRGEGVLNSKSEYSRCRLPRLVIDHDGWKKSKQDEKKSLESGEEQKAGPEEEYWEEWTSNLLEDELDMENMRRKAGSRESKRKAEENNKPAKRKKMENLMDWGAEGSLEEEDNGIRKWLLAEVKPEGTPLESGTSVSKQIKKC